MKKRLGAWTMVAGAAVLMAGCGEGMKGLRMGRSNQLEAVRYDFVYSIEVFERHLSISPEGEIEVWQQNGNEPSGRKAAIGKLTAEQRKQLLDVFSDWDSVKENNEVFIRGPVIYITYGEKRVIAAGGESTPKDFLKAQRLLDSIAEGVLKGGSPATPPPVPAVPPA